MTADGGESCIAEQGTIPQGQVSCLGLQSHPGVTFHHCPLAAGSRDDQAWGQTHGLKTAFVSLLSSKWLLATCTKSRCNPDVAGRAEAELWTFLAFPPNSELLEPSPSERASEVPSVSGLTHAFLQLVPLLQLLALLSCTGHEHRFLYFHLPHCLS